ncbi:MAG: serine hydrolase, partial [Vulcanimicrobiaceae bacterium]
NMTTNDAESPLVAGYATTLRDLCERAIERSDNVATNELFDLVGRERATSLAHKLGLRHTFFARKLSGSDPLIVDTEWDGTSRNRHPASDAAALLRSIACNDYTWSSQIATMLSAQAWNDKLSVGLRAGDAFAHKTGDTSEVTHDAGILKTHDGRVYVLVVYAAIESNEANNARFGAFMRALRPLL